MALAVDHRAQRFVASRMTGSILFRSSMKNPGLARTAALSANFCLTNHSTDWDMRSPLMYLYLRGCSLSRTW